MANRILQGADWSVAGNWIQTPGGGSGVPVSNDVAIMKSSALVVNAGLDQGGVDLDELILPPMFSGSVGSSGSPLLIAADLVKVFGTGSLFFSSDLDGVSALQTDEIRIQAANAATRVEIGSNPADAGKIDTTKITRGDVKIRGDTVFTATSVLEVGYESSRLGDASVVVGEVSTGSGNVETYRQTGGNVVCKRQMTAGNMTGGALIQDVAAITGRFDVYGGTLFYDHEANSDGQTIVVWPGATLNLCRNSFAKTLSSTIRMPGGILVYDKTIHTLNLTDLEKSG